MKLCFEVSGEHPSLPAAEISAVAEAVGGRRRRTASDGCAVFLDAPTAKVGEIAGRLALTRHVSAVMGSAADVEAATRDAALSEIAGERVRVRARIISGGWQVRDRERAERAVGAALSAENSIDLGSPSVEVRVLLGKEVSLCRLVHSTDRTGFEARKGENRPFFSPVSLHPKYARALVNLSRVRGGGRLLDPFCGTGGILIEAAMVGAEVLGSDIDRRMLEGSMRNLSHFGLGAARLARADVSEIWDVFGEADAIATDPPYGRASYTAKERPLELHARMLGAFAEVLRPGGHAAVILPDMTVLDNLPEGLEVVEAHRSRVHGSLVRHFVVMRRAR